MSKYKSEAAASPKNCSAFTRAKKAAESARQGEQQEEKAHHVQKWDYAREIWRQGDEQRSERGSGSLSDPVYTSLDGLRIVRKP